MRRGQRHRTLGQRRPARRAPRLRRRFCLPRRSVVGRGLGVKRRASRRSCRHRPALLDYLRKNERSLSVKLFCVAPRFCADSLVALPWPRAGGGSSSGASGPSLPPFLPRSLRRVPELRACLPPPISSGWFPVRSYAAGALCSMRVQPEARRAAPTPARWLTEMTQLGRALAAGREHRARDRRRARAVRIACRSCLRPRIRSIAPRREAVPSRRCST